MRQRTLGSGLQTPVLGYGAWVLTGTYGAIDEAGAVKVINHAIDRGVTMIDTSDAYGPPGSNEELVGKAIAGRQDEVIVATKWGMAEQGGSANKLEISLPFDMWVDASPERAKTAAEASLRRLGVEAIDLWFLHWPDPGRPIEEVVGGMAELVQAGKVRHIGLSNHSAEQLRRAQAVHPITAIQNEYSLGTRALEVELLPTARELGVGIVAWAPLSQGLLSGSVSLNGDGDVRSYMPRFNSDNLSDNLDRFAPFRALASELDLTPTQLALAWLLHQGEDIVAIPGTRNPEHIDSNVVAAEVELDDEVLRRIDELAPAGLVTGEPLHVVE